MKFPKTLQAANAVSTDRKALAAALYAEIPPRGKGRTKAGTATIDELLAEAAAELAEQGHVYSVDTLDESRKVAAWAAGNGGEFTPISWQPVAWSAHLEALKGGMSYETFAAHVSSGEITGVDSLRRLLGKPTTRAITAGEKVTKVLDAIKAGEVEPAELRELRDAILPTPEPAPPRLSDRGKSREQLADEAFWAKVRNALGVLIEALERLDDAPADVVMMLSIIRPTGDWDTALHDLVEQ